VSYNFLDFNHVNSQEFSAVYDARVTSNVWDVGANIRIHKTVQLYIVHVIGRIDCYTGIPRHLLFVFKLGTDICTVL